MNQPVFLGSGGRVARLVAKCWGEIDDVGETPLLVGRSGDAHLMWDMATPPPVLPNAPAAVVNFAGVVPRSGRDLSLNTDLAMAAYGAACHWNARHVFFCSSSAVYGDPGPGDAPETPDPTPRAPYGAAKLDMERALAAIPAGAGPGITILRLANVAWAGQPFDAAQEKGTTGVPLHRFDDGRGPSRSYIGPRTLARVLARLCSLATEGHALPFLLNVAAPHPTAMVDILSALGQPWHWTPAPEGAIQRVHLDVSHLLALCPLPDGSGTARALVDELPKSVSRI